VDGAMFNKLIENIVTSFTKHRGMKDANLAHKLVCFGVDKIIIFQGEKIGVLNLCKNTPIF